MTFTEAEQRFMARQDRGHLATVGPDGIPQVKPLGFTYNGTLGTIDISGWNMAGSAKYRNVRANPHVAFVVDEVTAPTMEGAHFWRSGVRRSTPSGPATQPKHLAWVHPDSPPPRPLVQRRPRAPGFAARDVGPGEQQVA